MLYERLLTYLSQKDMPISEEYLMKLATKAGYTAADSSETIKRLAAHEYIVREEWYPGRVTFAWVKDLVEYNRSQYAH